MRLKHIGIDLPANELGFRQVEYDKVLDRYHQEGWKALEISIDGMNLLIHSEFLKEPTASAVDLFRSHPFHYSVHGHMRINLAFDDRQDLVWESMLAQIEFGRKVGADRLVIHCNWTRILPNLYTERKYLSAGSKA